MDLDLPAEHQLLRDTIRDFMTTEVAPLIDQHERERRFPTEIVRRIGELGWLGIPIPEDEGGAGMDTLAYAIAIEEIGRVWGSLGLIVAAHTSLGCGPLHLAGTPEQKQQFLVPMASGQVLGGYGLTEPGAGSDAGGTRTTARHEDGADGGAWVIDGGKRFITNAGQAGTYIITARTGSKDDGAAEISAFILPADTPGFRVVRIEDKLGLHASATRALALVWKSAWLKDQGRDYSLVAAQAKLFASEVSSRVTNAAIQVHGGYGYVTDYPVERYLRDAKLTEIGEGTSQVQRLVIARKILGLRIG